MNEIHNIILICLIIILLFIISGDETINNISTKNYLYYILPIFIIYFVYQGYNLSFIVVLLLIIVCTNVNMIQKINNNAYFKKIQEYFTDFVNRETFTNEEPEKVTYSGRSVQFNITSEEENKKQEPFKNEVENIKELYENIKNEINNILK
jgi:Ca2+/Na+ antiporter